MSKERALLKEIIRHFAEGGLAIIASNSDVGKTLHNAQELLAQPEQEFRGLRTNGDSYSQEPVAKSIADRINTPTSLQDLNDCIDWALTQQGQEPLSDEVLYLDRLRKKVEMMKKEWIEYNLTDNLINDFFVCARKELADEGVESE